MRVQKITTQDEELEIKEATLLTAEEAERLPKRLRKYGAWWWLRSPGSLQHNAADVDDDGVVYFHGNYVDDDDDCVRPALKIQNLESSNFEIGDAFIFKNKKFEVIDETTAFCLEDIGTHCFRNDWKANDANEYDKSDVKKYVEDWFNA